MKELEMTNKTILSRIPENTSFLQPTKFSFVFPTLAFLVYYCQTVNLPAVTTQGVKVESPFAPMYRHGDTLVYEPLTVTVLLDEDMRVWEESHNWILALTKPENFQQYLRIDAGKTVPYHDGVLTVMTNANIPNIRYTFRHCHPVSIGEVRFSETENANTIMTLDITFRYDTYNISRLP